MQVTIDPKAGYCFGVKNAIGQAEAILEEEGALYSLGHIVHNPEEVKRLAEKGLKVIDHFELNNLRNCNVLIRAHGEPPSTYDTAFRNNITLIDATCPIVKHLQRKVGRQHENAAGSHSQVVIYGKKNHPEVLGLAGQTNEEAVVVSSLEDIHKLDPSKNVHLYAQTTMEPEGLEQISKSIELYLQKDTHGMKPRVFLHHTICRQVTDRIEHLKGFAAAHQVILFVSGKESSNGRFLFEVCRNVNQQSYQIENRDDIDPAWFSNTNTIGISGATSTPVWQMNDVLDFIASLNTIA